MPKTICLVSPGHLSTNPRLVKEAQALQQAGFETKIIHGRYQKWSADADRDIERRLGNVASVPFGPIEASRLTYVRQTLVRKGAESFVRAGLDVAPFLEAGHSPILPDLVRETCSKAADLYIAHYVAALPAVARAARKFGVPYAFDAEDFHLGDLPDLPEHAVDKRIIRAIESRYLPGASYVTAASTMIAKAYAEVYGISRPTVLLNVFPKDNAPVAATSRGFAEPGPSLYWFSQTIGPGRGLELAIEAVSRTESRPHLYVRGIPAAGYEDTLRRLAYAAGVADRLHVLQPAPPDDLERLGAVYDLGYVGELADTHNRQIALTNKLFSYMLGGVPSIASDIPAHRAIARELGDAITLFPIGDAAALAAAMDSMLLNPVRLAAARAQAWKLGQEQYNWDVEQQNLVACVREALCQAGDL